jgi:hypothetical protein
MSVERWILWGVGRAKRVGVGVLDNFKGVCSVINVFMPQFSEIVVIGFNFPLPKQQNPTTLSLQ